MQDNKIMYSFTTSFSSEFNLGSLTYPTSQTDSKLVIIVYSLGIMSEMKTRIDNIILVLNSSLNIILAMIFFILIFFFVANSILLCSKIGNLLNNARNFIQTYTENPSNYYEVITGI